MLQSFEKIVVQCLTHFLFTPFFFHLTPRSQFLPSVAEHETLFLQVCISALRVFISLLLVLAHGFQLFENTCQAQKTKVVVHFELGFMCFLISLFD